MARERESFVAIARAHVPIFVIPHGDSYTHWSQGSKTATRVFNDGTRLTIPLPVESLGTSRK